MSIRKIESEAEIEARRKRRNMYFTVFMLFILLVSTAGYAFLSGDKTTQNSAGGAGSEENAQSISIGGEKVYLTMPRESVKNVSVDEITRDLNFYGGEPVYVVSDSQAVTYELFSSVGRIAGKIQSACYGNCSENLPEKNCDSKLIVWNSSAENKVYQIDNCIFIDGDLRAVDAFIYKLFG